MHTPPRSPDPPRPSPAVITQPSPPPPPPERTLIDSSTPVDTGDDASALAPESPPSPQSSPTPAIAPGTVRLRDTRVSSRSLLDLMDGSPESGSPRSTPMGASALRRMKRSRGSTPHRSRSLPTSTTVTALATASLPLPPPLAEVTRRLENVTNGKEDARPTVVAFGDLNTAAAMADAHLNACQHRRQRSVSQPGSHDGSASTAGSNSSAPVDVQRQLKHLQLGHKRSALAHTIASRNYRRLHRKFTFYIMLINTIGVVMQQILQGSGASKTVVSIFNSAMFSVVGGLTSINNFLGYGSLEIKHLSMRNEHNAIHDAIADAFAISNERGIQIDWQDILEDVRERERPLAENGVQIPEDILQRFRNMSEEELDTQALG